MDLQLLREQLIICSKEIRGKWGVTQNNAMDKIGDRMDIWNIDNLQVLKDKLNLLNGWTHKYYTPEEKEYTIHRWYILGCSKCDEYEFYTKPNVIANPNHKDKDWDVEFHNDFELRRDLKNTVLPKEFRGQEYYFYDHPEELIKWFYDHQSQEKRLSYNNRLFVVHISHNPLGLRGRYDIKDKIFSEYIETLKEPYYKQFSVRVVNTILSEYCTVVADIIFIIEDNEGNVTHKFASSKLN
jgi:hypothetical protein